VIVNIRPRMAKNKHKDSSFLAYYCLLNLECCICPIARDNRLSIRSHVGQRRDVETLAALLRGFASTYGISGAEIAVKTPVTGVRVFGASEPISRRPLLYDSGIIIIGQGHKVGYLGGESFRYDAGSYLVVSVPIPFEVETHASADEPLLGISIDVNPNVLRDLILTIGSDLALENCIVNGPVPRAVEPVGLDAKMANAVERLVMCLQDPLESKALGQGIVNEILFRVLLGSHGRVLRMLSEQHTPYARVARSLALIHAEYATPLDVPALARIAAMSPSAFHRAFKQVTGESPIQYVKHIRLHRAHALLAQVGLKAGTAAVQVGYSSPSQFSREFKRYFGASPSDVRRAC